MFKQKLDTSDPYTGAIKSLVIKTLTILALIAVVIVGGIGIFISSKGRSKASATQATEPAETQIAQATPAVLAATTTPSTSASPTSSPTSKPTATPTPKPSTTPSPTITSTPTPQPTPTTTSQGKTINATASLDGYQSSNGEVNGSGDIRIGASKTKTTRGFVSFDISSLKSTNINKVTLKIFQAKMEGNPYTSGGSIKVDSVNYGNTFDSSDYSVSSLSPSFATLSDNTNTEWKSVDVTSVVKDAISQNRNLVQFRLHFTTETLGKTDGGEYALFESAENALKTGNTPQLIIE